MAGARAKKEEQRTQTQRELTDPSTPEGRGRALTKKIVGPTEEEYEGPKARGPTESGANYSLGDKAKAQANIERALPSKEAGSLEEMLARRKARNKE